MQHPISVTIITLNEEENLPQALKSVEWAQEVVVVDSGSTDNTVTIAKNFGAQVFSNPWPGYGQQKNFAQSKTKFDWVLNIDADEVVTPELRDEILMSLREVSAQNLNADGFYFPRKTFYLGRWIRHGGWYPNHLVRLARKSKSSWSEPEVHEALRVEGAVLGLKSDLAHYTFSSIQDQIMTNLRFSKLGSLALKKKGQRGNLFKIIFKPMWKFIETYFLKLGFLDGVAGFIIAINSAHSTFLKYAYLIEADLVGSATSHRVKNLNS